MRMAARKAGPVITDNGNYVLDWEFRPREQGEQCRDWAAMHQRLKLMPGMVETGLFIGAAECAYFAMPDATIEQMMPTPLGCARNLT